MKYLLHLIKGYPVTSFLIAVIWTLSLLPFFPETPLDDVAFIDKWVHIAMYGGTFSILWIEYIVRHRQPNKTKLFFWAWLGPILMGGLLELLQAYATTTRSGEWLDFAANSTGVTLACLLGMLACWLKFR